MWNVYDQWGKLFTTVAIYAQAVSIAKAIGGVVMPAK